MLEFDRLNLITQSTKEIATKALMLKIRGFSDIKPDNTLNQALAIRLQSINGSKTEGTSLLLDCDYFEETIRNLQLNMFKPTEELLKLTPMALVIQTFRSALLDEYSGVNWFFVTFGENFLFAFNLKNRNDQEPANFNRNLH